MPLWTYCVCIFLCGRVFSVLLDIYLGVAFLGHRMLSFAEEPPDCRGPALLSTPARSKRGFHFLFIPVSLRSRPLMAAVLASVKWCLVALFCVSLMAKNVGRLLLYLFAIHMLSLKKCLFKSVARFKIVFLLLKSSSYILDTKCPCRYIICPHKYLSMWTCSPILWVIFSLT